MPYVNYIKLELPSVRVILLGRCSIVVEGEAAGIRRTVLPGEDLGEDLVEDPEGNPEEDSTAVAGEDVAED